MTSRPPFPLTVPTGKTARRLEWKFLPAPLRDLIERRCGSTITGATSMGAGFTPGFASVLTCADGSRHFVKAASIKAQRPFAEAYREEARKLGVLPVSVPAPRLLWTFDKADWVVLGLEYVDAKQPKRPWRAADLDRTLDALEATADGLTPGPDLALDDFADDMEPSLDGWDHVRAHPPALPACADHLDEAADLAAGFAEVAAGTAWVHTDVRDDNVLLARDGRTLICDWNWPCRGAAWLDSVFTLIGPYGDGLDVEKVLAERRLTRDVPTGDIDRVLALLVGYFAKCSDDPVPPTSPYIREHQRWCRDVTWDWLATRRGWL